MPLPYLLSMTPTSLGGGHLQEAPLGSGSHFPSLTRPAPVCLPPQQGVLSLGIVSEALMKAECHASVPGEGDPQTSVEVP